MSVLSKLKSFQFKYAYFTPVSSYTISLGGANAGANDYDYQSLVDKAYETNPVVAACLGAWQRALMEPEIVAKNAKGEESKKNSIQQLLRRPSEEISMRRFLQSAVLFTHIGGSAYVFIERNIGKKAVALKLLHAGQCRPIHKDDSPNYIDGFEVLTGKGWQPQPKEDVIILHGMYASGTSPAESQSPLAILATQSDALAEAHRYILGVLRNDAVPRTFVKLTPGAQLEPDAIKDINEALQPRLLASATLNFLKDKFTQAFGGKSIGKPLVADGVEDVRRIGLGLDELNIDSIEKSLESYICSVLGVPVQVVGVKSGLEYSTDNNMENAYYRFVEQSVIPMLNSFAESLTFGLKGQLEEDVEFSFDLNTISAYRRMSQIDRSNTFKNGVLPLYGYVGRGQMTPEVARFNLTRFWGVTPEDAEQLIPDTLEAVPQPVQTPVQE